MSISRARALALIAAAPTLARCTFDRSHVRVGSKNFTESFLIAEIYAQALENAGMRVERLFNLGSTQIAMAAMERGNIDCYPEYTGTALIDVLHLPPIADSQTRIRRSSRGLRAALRHRVAEAIADERFASTGNDTGNRSNRARCDPLRRRRGSAALALGNHSRVSCEARRATRAASALWRISLSRGPNVRHRAEVPQRCSKIKPILPAPLRPTAPSNRIAS